MGAVYHNLANTITIHLLLCKEVFTYLWQSSTVDGLVVRLAWRTLTLIWQPMNRAILSAYSAAICYPGGKGCIALKNADLRMLENNLKCPGK